MCGFEGGILTVYISYFLLIYVFVNFIKTEAIKYNKFSENLESAIQNIKLQRACT